MKSIHYAKTLTGAACLALLPLTASAQDDFDPAKMEEIMKKYLTPGKEHKVLRSWVGTWKTESTYWMMPGAPPMKSSGEATFRMLLKGRYVTERFTTKSPDFGDFQGQGTVAYDRLAKEYIHTWIDTMGTGIMISRGQASEDGTKIEYTTVYKDPMTMQDIKYRIVTHVGDPKKRKMEMFATHKGKEEHKHMEITYTKIAGPKKKGEGKAEAKGTTEKKSG
jgi:hypothetical protein